MRIRHIFSAADSRSMIQGDRGFFLRNQMGDFLSLFTLPQTRYEGWFIQKDFGNSPFTKILDRVEVISESGDAEKVIGITNTGSTTSWEMQGGTNLTWKLLTNLSGLTLASSHPTRLRVTLDMRGMYDRPEMGRSYDIRQDSSGSLINYSDPLLKQGVYLHIRSQASFKLQSRWKEQLYPRDVLRHSEPTRLYVYILGEVQANGLAFGVGNSAKEAQEASLAAIKQRPQLPTSGISTTHDTLVNQVATARICAQNSLRLLQSSKGIYAGLPWFHQVWARDELITALGYTLEEQHEVIDQYLGHPLQEGELPTFVGSHSTCADGVGWLTLLAREYDENSLSEDTRQRLTHFLETAHQQLRQYRLASHGLIASGHNATWMDTIGRSGFRLEIQCMYALLLEVLYSLTDEPAYKQEYISFRGKIRQHFFRNSYLHDGLGDPTKRPNVFLAYLLQPELLNQDSWQHCFDAVLSSLRCPWGGLSSLDQSHALYHPYSTGEDNQSYHNGDSWFFINNLTAIALHRLNQSYYGKTIVDILQSSTQEILWEHLIGQPGEISSAAELDSYGCGIQAFSAGTYLALLNQMENYSVRQNLDTKSFFWDSTARSTSATFFKYG